MGDPVTQFTIEPPAAGPPQFTIEPPAKTAPSAMPSAADWLHAAGFPASMAEAKMTPMQAAKLGLTQLAHAADPTFLSRNIVVPMIEELHRAATTSGDDPMRGIHALAGINPFAAPIVSRMSELRGEGKEGEATATGVIGAATLATGEVAPRVGPAVASTKAAMRTAGEFLENNAETARAWAEHPVQKTAGAVTKKTIETTGKLLQKIAGPEQQPAAPGSNLTGNLSNMAAPVVSPQAAAGPQLVQPAPAPAPAPAPSSMAGYYGKTAGKSSLKANQRQLASPTASTAPNPGATSPFPPEIAKILGTPGELSDVDMATLSKYDFAKRKWK